MRIAFRSRVAGAALVVFALIATACGSGDDTTATRPAAPTTEAAATTQAPTITEAPSTTEAPTTTQAQPTIVIGSFGFGESEILGEIYRQALEANGYPADHNRQIGPREIVKPALEAGEIHFVPEYVGSALEVGFGGSPTADAEETRALLAAAYEPDVAVLGLSPAEDKNVFVVTRSTAAEFGLVTVSDLSNLGDRVLLGGPPECPDRPRCKLGLESTYELTVDFVPLDAGGPLTVAALEGDEVQVGLLFSTFVFNPDFVRLDDDKGLQPAENIVPVVRSEIIDAYGQDFIGLIDSISAALDTEELTELNRRFGVEQEDADTIAEDWLTAEGFL